MVTMYRPVHWFVTPHGPQSVAEPEIIREFRRRDYPEITAQQAADFFAKGVKVPDVSFITGQELPAAMAAAAADPNGAFAARLRAALGSPDPVLSDFVYDPATGNLLSYKEDGIAIVLTYNPDGTVATSKRGDGPVRTFAYSGGNLAGVA